jgi:hypothetical protein
MESKTRLQPIAWLVATVCVIFIGLQFVRPKLANPEVTADLQAPAYWIVARDVNERRKHLNFSEIGKLPLPQQRGILFESISQIERPLPAYKRAHPESVITTDQLGMLKQYLGAGFALSGATPADVSAADAQCNSWVQRGSAGRTTQPAPNGIESPADYKNWKTIGSTDRLDNGTIREILGNDIAIRAIANKQINPWPVALLP